VCFYQTVGYLCYRWSCSVVTVVTLTLSAPALAPLRISLSTANGTARARRDYSATTRTINIPIGGTSGTASVPIINEAFTFSAVVLSGLKA
jgi:hypothetical protein